LISDSFSDETDVSYLAVDGVVELSIL
jgi:hypothetical protein